MIHKASRLIEEAFQEKDVKYIIREQSDASIVEAGFTVKNCPTAMVRFISEDNSNNIAVRMQLMPVTDEKVVPLVMALNECNTKYRYLRFTMDEDQDIMVEYDFPQSVCDNCIGEAAFEIFIRTMQIMEEAYPILMRALWA